MIPYIFVQAFPDMTLKEFHEVWSNTDLFFADLQNKMVEGLDKKIEKDKEGLKRMREKDREKAEKYDLLMKINPYIEIKEKGVIKNIGDCNVWLV